ncbi:hypothetical protein J6590_023609 [Homalodisca vitripennis]|nr:hypothetical protein J6590_023609 [Homalodisca vitripennis]
MFVYGLLQYLYVDHSATDCFLAVDKCAFGSKSSQWCRNSRSRDKCAFGSNSSQWCRNSRSRGECLFTDCYNIYTFTTPPLIASWLYTSVRLVQTVVGGAATHGAEGRDVHHYETRGRDNFRTEQHRTTAFGHLPSQVGVTIINRLPEEIKHLEEPKTFKSRLKRLLVLKAFYSVEEFMMGRWDENP